MKDLTEALMKTQVNPVNTNVIYMNSDTCDMFWDIVYDRKFIDVYGIKQIGKQDDMFIYEGVLFDKFPDNYDSLYISYRNRFDCERAEEIEVLELTDTKIVFKYSVKIPEDKNNIILQWD
jgi:hypothetical protein